MARKVGEGLTLPAGRVRGYIASSHVYLEDMPAIEHTLGQALGGSRAAERRGSS